MDGWVKLHRKSIESKVFKNPNLWRLFSWCLMKATHQEKWVTLQTGRGKTQVKLMPGQLIFGRHQSAEELGMKPSTIRNQLHSLATMQNVDIKPDTHYSIITITNWGTYQSDDDIKGQLRRHPKDTQRTQTRKI